MKYYDLMDDINYPNRWYLGDVLGTDNWLFREPSPSIFERDAYKIEVYQDGQEMDFTIGGYASVLVASEKVKKLFETIPDAAVRFIPVTITNKKVSTNYYLMITMLKIDAVDQEKSEFTRYEENDPVRPDLAGKYSGFYKLVIDESKAAGHPIFRIEGYDVTIIASEVVKQKFEDAGIAADFTPVN